MNLTPTDLMSLEEYDRQRNDYRQKIMAHKKNRRLPLGENASLYFEDALTMQYQIQEMLRAEKIFDQAGIQEELDVYNTLIPDGKNWKATFMLEYSDIEVRQAALATLIGIEQKIWLQIGDNAKVYPIANEDLERETSEKTSAVHFLRFELTDTMIADLKAGADLNAGIEHSNYQVSRQIPDNIKESLIGDLD